MKIILPVILLLMSASSFSSTSTIKCIYKSYSDAEGSHKVKKDLVLSFLLDSDNNKSYVLGNNGSNEVVKIVGTGHVTFLESTSSGNVMTTTITDNMKTVHSRNSVLFGKLIPSQYYGECEAM
ncbi:hypothetical protein [Photobacterium leiognathi]|uniref:Adhesin n=1 Tax=Photobacterium leiognathi subsp. mandapamensis TaxID=48408 RepID=A0A2T3KUJ6_PHOLD|nr:hypothetical protein [Photobacterium leiognathi]PSV10468.1 hypothetical protein C0W93_12145 [Photobacterium leiognathi subsp. mandapamensis]